MIVDEAVRRPKQISPLSINLLAFYHECCSLIDYEAIYLSLLLISRSPSYSKVESSRKFRESEKLSIFYKKDHQCL